jgi:hypothetical protein
VSSVNRARSRCRSFADIEIDGESRTAIRLTIEDRTHRAPEPVAHGARTITVTEPDTEPAFIG